MALFIVRHQHAAERCPVADPQMGAMLLNHLIKREAARSRDPGEAIVQGEHTLYLIAKAHDESGEPECPWRKFRIGLEVLFRGADGGTLAGNSGPNCFERSLQIDTARAP